MIASHIAELEDHLHALQEAVEAAKCVEAALADKDAVIPPPEKNFGLPKKLEHFLSRK